MIKKNSFLANIFYAFSSQFVSLSLSILMSLLLPKFMGVTEYSYFQLFIFYSSYSGFLLFGINDGIYLRFGGKNYDEIDKNSIGNQWKIITLFQLIISIVVIILMICSNGLDANRKYVIIWTCLYMVIYNSWGFYGYIFQAVNETQKYSKSIMIDRFGFLIIMLFVLMRRISSFEIFIMFYTLTKLFSLVYLMYHGKSLISSRFVDINDDLKEMLINIRIGSKLMFASIASMLILGIGRMFIDNYWGIEYFGKISLALSLTNFFLQFVSQISMVLFPTLRQINQDNLKEVFSFLNEMLFLFIPIVYIIYPILSIILKMWLPQYIDSLSYLGIILPICVFDCKMSLLYNTFFKVCRLEKKLLFINVITVIISFVLSSISTFLFNNIIMLLVSMVASIAFRSICSSIILEKEFKTHYFIENTLEIVISVLFIVLINSFNEITTSVIFLFFYLLIISFNKNKVIYIFRFFNKKGVL